MKKRIIYLIAITLLAASCASDDIHNENNTLSGDGVKTPIGATALLDAGGASTRAANKDFANGDKLLAYLRHVEWNGSTGARTLVSVQNSPKLVTFTKGSTDMTPYSGTDITPIGTGAALGLTSSNTKQTADLTADPVLYWDDFSANDANDGKDGSLNIRDAGHYLQSYYGYCYNGSPAYGQTGSHITSDLVAATGVLGWNVSADQRAADKSAFKTSDLLWSAEQTPIEYAHVDGEGKKNHGTLILPYTHAMSKVTINITLLESFGDGANFSGVTTKLHEMFTHCTCTAPTYTLTNKGTTTVGQTTDITMWNAQSANTSNIKECTFEAIVVPSVLSVVNNFATITGLDGNTYAIPITEKMLQKGSEHGGLGWGDELTETDEHINNGTAQAKPGNTRSTTTIPQGKGYEMKSGVNYVLNVNISKQQITVSALIKDWVNVEAEGTALVQFNPDVTGKQEITNQYLKDHGIDVYKNSVNTAFTNITTKLTWDNTYNKWKYLVPNNSDWIEGSVYWAGQDDASYFRALSPAGSTTSMSQNNDLLWGYACDDNANNGNKVGETNEVAITPRTGDVLLHFEHPMSKISVKLETPEGTPSDPKSPAVDLTDARISISNLATTGTIELVKGKITAGAITIVDAITGNVTSIATESSVTTGTTSVKDLAVIPQTIGNDARLKLTLADGTTYSLQLNTCVDSNSTANPKPAITEWERGKHYTYTIHVEKEAITFRAMIKEWDEKNGSGNATLEWD